MSIAQELEDRMWYLADPAVKWVRGTPRHRYIATSCLVYDSRADGTVECRLSMAALTWLESHWEDSDGYGSPSFINDFIARDRNDVLWMLQEAVDQARWEGV